MNIKIASVALFSSVILSCGTMNEIMNEIMKGVEDVLNESGTSSSSIPSNLEMGNGLKEVSKRSH